MKCFLLQGYGSEINLLKPLHLSGAYTNYKGFRLTTRYYYTCVLQLKMLPLCIHLGKRKTTERAHLEKEVPGFEHHADYENKVTLNELNHDL